MGLSTKGSWFIDNEGRRVLLRGVNLGGSSKMPIDDGATHIPTDFRNHRDVSFVGRPFPIKEADEHFNRLKYWGFNCLRFITTWEAIEHKGPRDYDLTYLDYLKKIIKIAGDYDFYVFLDPHQDVWSRMTGGDGAPAWTFEKVGLDFTKFGVNGAAKVMQYHYPQNYQMMEWFMNYFRFATATMFSLFFGSKDFAPNANVEGISVQDYLQSHFIDSMVEVAKRVKDLDHVIGFDALNEPSPGFIGNSNLGTYHDLTPPGLNFTPFDAIAAGSGYPRLGKRFAIKMLQLKEVGEEILNPDAISSWIDDEYDIWRNEGLFEIINNKPKLLRPYHFKFRPDGTRVEFAEHYLRPFSLEYITKIREIIPETLLFIEGDPSDPMVHWDKSDPPGVVNGSHWYDGFMLLTKTFRPWLTINQETIKPIFRYKNVKKHHKLRLQILKNMSENIHGGIPTLIGEFGIPFDMNKAKAYSNGNFKSQIKALTHLYDLMDELQLHSAQWNYTSDNSNEWGDLWNKEDFSIYSHDQEGLYSGIDNGGRAIEGFCRPHPLKISGEPVEWKFNLKKKKFTFIYQSEPGITEVYIPNLHFSSPEISVNIPYTLEDQILTLTSNDSKSINLTIRER